ncbi:MAG: cysteine hydrolase [Chloroflexi bacterium]|nr:cysteine hydrolase [Chloroflexota bacterium]
MLPLEQKVRPEHTALIVVDVQNDFCHSDGAGGRRGKDMRPIQAMVPRLVDFIAKARENGVPIIFIRTSHGAWTDSEVWRERAKDVSIQEIPICAGESWGTEFYLVEPRPEDKIVWKHRYSAFYCTDLDVVLRARGIKTVLTTGVTTNTCVETTSRDAFQRDYYVVLVENCCGTSNPEDHQATLRNIGNNFGVVATADEVVEAWGKRG